MTTPQEFAIWAAEFEEEKKRRASGLLPQAAPPSPSVVVDAGLGAPTTTLSSDLFKQWAAEFEEKQRQQSVVPPSDAGRRPAVPVTEPPPSLAAAALPGRTAEALPTRAAAPERKPNRWGSIGDFAKKAAGRAYEQTGLKGTVGALDWLQRNVSEPIGATANVVQVPGPEIPYISRGGGFEFNPEQLPGRPDWRERYHENVPLGGRIATEVVLDPLNLVPGIGFTKMAQLRRLGGRLGLRGAARQGVEQVSVPVEITRAVQPEAESLAPILGIGEVPSQGALGLAGQEGISRPLINAEQVAERQRLAAERAAGQVGLPEAAQVPVPSPAAVAPPPPRQPPVLPTGTIPPVGGQLSGPRRALPIELFEAPAKRLLGLDTAPEQAIRKIPVLRQMYGAIDPAAIHQSEPVARLGITKQIFREEHHAQAKALSMEWMAEAKATLGFNSAGRAQRVQPVAGAPRGPLFRTVFDLVEHPERYILTAEQTDTIKRAQDIMDSVLKAEQAAGVEVGEVANYWYRDVLGAKDDKLLARLVRRAGTGGSKGHTRSRFYEFAEETIASGKILNLNPLSSLTRRLEAGINAIADKEVTKRVAELPGMETPLQRAEPAILATATAARRNRQVAQAAVLAIQRAKRGEQLPVSTIRAIERVLPEIVGQLKPASRITLDDLIQAGVEAGTTPRPRRAPVTILREPHMDALNDLLTQVRVLVGPSQQAERQAVSARAAEMTRVAQPRYGERSILGKIAPEELVNEIDKWVEVPGFGQRITKTGLGPEALRLWRSTLVSFDLSAGYIQGQSLFFRNNVAWWKTQAASVVSLVDQPFSYVSKNYDTIAEGIRNGAIVPPTEMLFPERGLASLPTRLPVVGSLFTRTNRAFEWFTFVGQHELYKAAKGTAAEKELVSLGSAIRKIMGTESYATLGVSRRQQAVEAYLAFAPRFYRALYGTVAQAFTPGAGGDAARKVMGSMIAGATAITIGANYVTQKKMPNFDDVESATWGKFKVGDSYVSAYGPFHSFFRTLARVGVYSNRGEFGRAETEVVRFFKSKASLPVRAAETAARVAITGSARTFEGERIDTSPTGVLNFLQEQTPIGLSQITQGAIEGRPEEALGIVGLNVNEDTRQRAKQYELAGQLPPKGTNIRVLRTAYYQAGEGFLSDAGRAAWRRYEPLPAGDRKLILRTFSPIVRREVKKVETYRVKRRKQIATAFPELDVLLVEEAWKARPRRSYTPKTLEGKRRLAELRRKKFSGTYSTPGRSRTPARAPVGIGASPNLIR